MPSVLALTEGYPFGTTLAGVFHVDQFREMASIGIDLTVVGPTPWVPPGFGRFPRWARYNAGPVRQEIEGFTVYRPRYPAIPGEARWLRPHWLQAWTIDRLGLPKPDLIHAFFALPLGATARELSRKWRVPYVTTVLGGDVTHLAQQSVYHRALLTRVLGDAAVSMANGPSLARLASEMTGVDVQTAPLGIDGSRFSNGPSKEAARHALGIDPQSTVILFVGSMIDEKGVGDLLAARSRLRNDRLLFLFVGDGPLRVEAERLEGCRADGAQPLDRISAYMAAADVFALPSRSEGLPTVVVEAGFAGIPVIGSDIAPIVDLLGAQQERGLTVSPGDIDSLARGIQQHLDNPTGAAERAARLRHFVETEHSVSNAVSRLAGIYQYALENPGATAAGMASGSVADS
jgi:teichuronic acid biosynthesis glycosyltransferase TuaC